MNSNHQIRYIDKGVPKLLDAINTITSDPSQVAYFYAQIQDNLIQEFL